LSTRTTEIELILQEWWNTQAAKGRVHIEQAFGMLKERWRGLKDLDVRLADNWLEHALVWNIVKAAMVLHNLYIDTINFYKPAAGWQRGQDRANLHEKPLEDTEKKTEPYRVPDPKNQRREDIAWLTGHYKLDEDELVRLWPAGPSATAKLELDSIS
jgi:hypothetical protein